MGNGPYRLSHFATSFPRRTKVKESIFERRILPAGGLPQFSRTTLGNELPSSIKPSRSQ